MKVFVASPRSAGTRFVADLDTSKRVQDMYYKAIDPKSEYDMSPVAYCFKLENRTEVETLLDKHLKEEKELRDRHYKELIHLRKLYGV